MRLDVFTLIPGAFAWLLERRPVAAVLGTELELRILNYRDTTPLRAGQVDDEPYGGGPGMVLRVDVVAAAFDAVYGGVPDHRIVALAPSGRLLDQELVEELAVEPALTLLSARFEGFDQRILDHLSSDVVSIGPYVLSGGEIPALAVVDAVYSAVPAHRVVALAPTGRQLDQELVEELAAEPALTVLSARFEGFDQRILDHLCTDVVSIGPYVLSGGEIPALAVVDAVVRRLPGALTEGSVEFESFSAALDGGLEYPHYTRPAEFRGWEVPEILLSGDHGRIDAWRRERVRSVT